jgi:PAS domain S-box-containing protein
MTQLADSTLLGLLDAVPDAMLAVNEAGLIVLVNAQAERLFGYRREDLIGRPVELLVPIADPKFRPYATGLQMAGRRQDGSEFPASVSVSTMTADTGLLISATIRDATEVGEVEAERIRVKTEAERARLEVEADRVTAEGEKKEAERVRLEDEADRVTAEGEKTEAERARLEVEADRVTAEGEKKEAERVRLEVEADRVTAEGEKKEAERVRLEAEAERVTAERVRLEAERVRLEAEAERVRLEAEVERERLGAEAERERLETEVERVTDKGEKTEAERGRLEAEVEHERLEGQLHQSQRMESLGQLAGGVAHDFNNLLAVITNYASFVSEELDDKEAAQNDLGQIRVAAERAAELTRQLLAFAGRKVLQPVIFDLNQVIVAVEQLLRRTIGEHVELVISLSTDPSFVEEDPGQLEQVLVNLAVNARDAMPDGGLLTIDTENSEIDEAYTETNPGVAPGRYVRLRVSDTGSGMEQAVLDHVFEPFFTTKPRGEGTGLGLPTVFGIVAQAGGEIRLYSEPGIGTTCQVLLPTTDRTPTIGRSLTEPRDLHGTETVLVVEDEDALREVARRILSRNGYVVLTSANGPEAIALVERHTGVIDLLLTDVIMPQMLGKEVAARIQELFPGLPVLYMSGYARPVLGPTLGEEIALLEKPFSEQLLLIKVRDVLDNVR